MFRSSSLFLLMLFIVSSAAAQLNMSDSTLQVIGYWDKNEKQTYTITIDKYKVKGGDTTARETYSYETEITIKDSTAKSYTIDWYYKNFKLDGANEMMRRLASVGTDMHVLFKTDEMGTFVEVVNWKEIRDYINKCTAALRKEYSSVPEMDKVIKNVQALYSSKEEIENGAIKDIQQFYSFHGGKYTLHEELKGNIKVANNYGGAPFNTDVTIEMDSLIPGDDQAVIRMWQSVDKTQLTDAAYDFIKKMGTSVSSSLPSRNEFPDLENETRLASLIHGGSGWVVYSVETKEVGSSDSFNIEERTIELN